ncbi:MAG: hypothetical protein WCR27_03725 [Eubacteriales bacterium]
MKSKFKVMAASAIAGCLLLSVSVTAFAASGGNGYQTFKDTVTSTFLTRNATVSAQFEVKDNNAIVLSGNTVQKLDGQNSSSNTSLNIDGTTQTIETSRTADKYIAKIGDQYYSSAVHNRGRDVEKMNLSASSSTVKLAETVADTLVGDVKNQFIANGNTISVKLEGAQIPQLAKLAISAAAENVNNVSGHKGTEQDQGMKAVLSKIPQLSNIDVKSIEMTATVSENTLTANQYSIIITGVDANGVSHQIEISVNAKVSDVNTTQSDTIDTTGKNVIAKQI